MVGELDANLVHVAITCHKRPVLDWFREQNLETINLLLPRTKSIPRNHNGRVYYAFYTAYPCDFWFTSMPLAVEFKLRF
jgi:hypothetical protein